jgi:hypothetical protein
MDNFLPIEQMFLPNTQYDTSFHSIENFLPIAKICLPIKQEDTSANFFFLTLNCRGIGILSNKFSLKRLLETHNL